MSNYRFMHRRLKGKVLYYPTDCCALCQLSIPDNASQRSIRESVELLKQNVPVEVWQDLPGAIGGERAAFVIVTPHERQLEQNLIEVGFKEIFQFERREGYPPVGQLKMYMIKI